MKCRTGILIDFDDTLVETTIQFFQAQDLFAEKMSTLGYPKEEVISMLEKIDIDNVIKCGGFHMHCFPDAMGQTYQYFCQINNKKVCTQFQKKLEDIGWAVFQQEPQEIPGARDVVEKLAEKYPLFLVTKGDRDNQIRRIKQKKFYDYFQKVHIVSDKKDKEFSQIIKENNLVASHSWMIGNSMKSDINPAIKQGINGIHVLHPHTWSFEEEEPAGDYIEVKDIREVLPIVMAIR